MTEPDYRFTLANERTFLAYLRTALALDAGGLAIAQYLPGLGTVTRIVLGTLVVACGGSTAVAGFLRWRANQRAIRADAPLPPTAVPLALVVATTAIAVAALLVGLT